jgi:hypothetical protein
MSKNIVFEPGYNLSVVVSDPATPASGDPVRYGQLTGIALADEGEGGAGAATETVCNFGPFVADLSVKAVDGSGNSAVALGDPLWYVDADTPKLSKKATGYFYGFAMEAIDAGETETIKVMHVPAPGTGALASGSIGSTQLANNGVTAAKLTASLATGFIPLSLAQAREIATNDIPNGAANGGLLASDTTPILKRLNGATDKKQVIEWAASNNDEIVWDFPYPPDLDDAAAIEVHLLARMGGATDTPVIAVSYFEGVGDSNAGGNTAALSATLAELTVSIAHANVGAAPNAASIGIAPGAHTNDTVQLLAAWIEYTRK